jgi:diguanylate cyclase (GGDEF)-like protein
MSTVEETCTQLTQQYSADHATQIKRTPRLLIVSGAMVGQQIELLDEPVVIGRASDCTLSLPFANVSRNHCRVFREHQSVIIEDLGSTNKTFVNGAPITDRVNLKDGDRVTVGKSVLKFFAGASDEANYHQELINLATFDSLTGLFNRRHFMLLLEEELGRVERDRSAISLIILDIDFFKRINDEMGHLGGDQALKMVSQVLRERARPNMFVGRLGGEEFGIFIRYADQEEAIRYAEDYRTSIAAQEFSFDGSARVITASFGVASWAMHFTEPNQLIKAADEALYRAKGEGRNRVCAAELA